MQNTIKKAAAAPARIGIPSDEEIYTSPEINRMISVAGNRLISSGLFPPWSREDEEEDLKLKLLEQIHESNFDPKKGDFNAFAGSIIRRLAGLRIYEARKKAVADGHIWSDDISLDSPEGEKLKVIDCLVDDHDYSAEERHARLERIEKVHKVLETMPEEYRYVWKRLCEGVSQRQLAKELGYKSHAGFRQKFMCRFKAEFVKAGIRRIETKGGGARQKTVE